MPAPRDSLQGLAEAIATKQCILHGGKRLGAMAGLPDWTGFAQQLLDWSNVGGFLTKARVVGLSRALKNEPDLVIDNIVNAVEAKGAKERLFKYMDTVFLGRLPSKAHLLLSSLPFAGVVTSNWDDLLERVFSAKRVCTFQDRDPPPFFHTSGFFLAKLYGTLRERSTLILTGDRFRDAIDENQPWMQFLQGLMVNRSMFFAGRHLDGLESFIETIRLKKTGREHWVLTPFSSEDASWQVKADRLKRKFNLNVIPYRGDGEFIACLEKLVALVSPGGKAVSAAPVNTPSLLRRLVVDNVGPFDHAEFRFHPRWNVLLGNNGVGKSSILRALAVAICGPEAAPYAERIIKSGRPSATILLETDRNTYLTSVHRSTSGVNITQVPVRPLEAEGWLALAFPPLRTVGSLSASASGEGLTVPTAEDLLPMLRGDADPRLDKLKQWIVNLDYRIKDQLTQPTPDSRFKRLFDEFFTIVGELTEGVPIAEPTVDPATRQVTVRTADGPIPLDLVSQGTASLISWVGVIMQRLYEVYGADKEPLKRHALVLVDEIDAHMHPGWQQMLVTKLEKIFPAVQFVASTHSPFIVAGMTGDQVHVFERDPVSTLVEISQPQMDFRGMRADQILTSVFGLTSSRDARSKRLHELKVKKFGGAKLTGPEAAELRELEQDPHAQTHLVADMPSQQAARAMLEDAANTKLAALAPDEQTRVLAELASEMRQVFGTAPPKPCAVPAKKRLINPAAKKPPAKRASGLGAKGKVRLK